ncbi:MAG: alpha/beta hydrolase [Acidimicrobiales bacterium]
MPLDAQAKMMIDGMKAMGFELHTPGITPEDMRRQMEERKVPPVDVPEMAKVEDRKFTASDGGQIPIRIYWPTDAPGPHPVVVFFHGGGWVIGSIESHDATVKSLAAASGMVFVSVDYRLAPEYKFPTPPEDCFAATKWVVENATELGVDASRLAVAGDSAGGNLAAAVALMARERGGPAIKFQLLIYPCTDFDLTRRSMIDNGDGYFLTSAAMDWFYGHYLAGDDDRAHHFAAPIRAELTGLPPALVITAEYDPLRDEGNDYARLLQAAGVPTTSTCYAGMIHGFFSMTSILDKAKDAQAQAVRALVAAL